MTKYTVEKLRIAYASGKYDNLELLLSYKDIVKGMDIEGILDYSVFPEVRKDLKQRILEVPKAQSYLSDYQNTLRSLAEKAEAMELSGNKHFPFAEQKEIARVELDNKLKELETIAYSDLRGFYIQDEGLEE